MAEKNVGEGLPRLLETIKSYLVAGNKEGVVDGVRIFLSGGGNPQRVLSEALIPGMSEIGQKMAAKEVFIPEVLVSAMAMQAALQIVRPLLKADDVVSKGTIVLGTVKGDVHDIGKNLVSYMLEGAGFQLFDLGISVSPEQFVDAVDKYHPQVIGMSAMLTTTMMEMSSVISALEKAGVRGRVKVIVGGAPVNREFALQIGADGYAEEAGGAIAEVEKLLANG